MLREVLALCISELFLSTFQILLLITFTPQSKVKKLCQIPLTEIMVMVTSLWHVANVSRGVNSELLLVRSTEAL